MVTPRQKTELNCGIAADSKMDWGLLKREGTQAWLPEGARWYVPQRDPYAWLQGMFVSVLVPETQE